MTYSHAEATLIAIEKNNIRFLARDLLKSGRDTWIDPATANEIATDLVKNYGWTWTKPR